MMPYKYHRPGGLHDTNLFSWCFGAWKSKINFPVCWILVRALSLGCRQKSFSPYVLFLPVLGCQHRGERKLSGVSSYKSTNPIMRAPPFWVHLTLNLPAAPSPNTITLGIKASTWILGDVDVQSITVIKWTISRDLWERSCYFHKYIVITAHWYFHSLGSWNINFPRFTSRNLDVCTNI